MQNTGVRRREAAIVRRRIGAWLVALAWLVMPIAAAAAADAPPPAMDNAMSSAGWLQRTFIQLENEATSDVSMLPDAPGAIDREWRTFDRNGSPMGALVNLGWVALATSLALAAERAAARGLGRRLRRAMRLRPQGPTVGELFLLLLCDIAGLAVFAAVFVYSRHWLMSVGVAATLILLASHVVLRWRIAALIVRVMLRPHDPPARLIELPDREARRLARFLSAAILAIVALVGFGRYGLMDEDSGAPHVVALAVVVIVCAIDALIVFRARAAAEALIRGCSGGVLGALRAAVARAWPAIGMTYVAGVFVFFVFGLSLGLLSYFYAVISTLGVTLLLLVLERLTERGWREPAPDTGTGAVDRIVGLTMRRIVRAAVLLAAGLTLAWIWVDAIEMDAAAASGALGATAAALVTLFVAYFAWELMRLTIDRHLQGVATGPKLPGAAEDEESSPGSRLQTVLPMMRFMFGALIAVIATLVVLSRLGIDTAPLIAGAGVFGLAISFGSQSLVRDIISGLFYMWDDAFRIGEYVDTGRLKGTVETLGIRSVKVRHHNGPLHTIPYGQLGAVSNLSRDFATIKFNLRLERDTDIELVRKTAKRVGIEMQEEPEIAAEVILPLKMQGIVEVADTAIVVRFKFTARPVKPSWVQREYVKRLYRVFPQKGIAFASGALTLKTEPAVAADTDAARPLAAASPLPVAAASRVA